MYLSYWLYILSAILPAVVLVLYAYKQDQFPEPPRIVFKTFLFAYFLSINLYAFEIENRLPKSIWEIEINFKNTPEYNMAFDGYGEKGPLHKLILWNFDWRENVEGEIKRAEQILEINLSYAFDEHWLFKAYLPLVNKKQVSSLNFESGNSNQKNILNNLESEILNLTWIGRRFSTCFVTRFSAAKPLARRRAST